MSIKRKAPQGALRALNVYNYIGKKLFGQGYILTIIKYFVIL